MRLLITLPVGATNITMATIANEQIQFDIQLDEKLKDRYEFSIVNGAGQEILSRPDKLELRLVPRIDD